MLSMVLASSQKSLRIVTCPCNASGNNKNDHLGGVALYGH